MVRLPSRDSGKKLISFFWRRMNSCYWDTKRMCSTCRFILCKFEVIHNNVHRKNGLRHVDVEIMDVSEICKAFVSVYFVYEGHIIQTATVVLVRWQNVTRFNLLISF